MSDSQGWQSWRELQGLVAGFMISWAGGRIVTSMKP
jgi:hypothetical protein